MPASNTTPKQAGGRHINKDNLVSSASSTSPFSGFSVDSGSKSTASQGRQTTPLIFGSTAGASKPRTMFDDPNDQNAFASSFRVSADSRATPNPASSTARKHATAATQNRFPNDEDEVVSTEGEDYGGDHGEDDQYDDEDDYGAQVEDGNESDDENYRTDQHEQVNNPDVEAELPEPPSAAAILDRGAALTQLRSPDQLRLLDAIDKLRAANIDADLSVPQIVVCGSQSSGKSAVLEAISHLPFPSGAGTNTKFATELILRKGPTTMITASIIPHANRTGNAKQAILGFSPAASGDLNDFAALHKQARIFLEKHNRGLLIWFDRLRIEVTGPAQPHLTLIDLPGLITADIRGPRSTSPQEIRDLVESYIRLPRAIVLAVFPAKIDVDNQDIANTIMIDKSIQKRTLGVITYLDMPMTTDQKTNNLELALNKKLQTGLGWHLVANLDHEKQDRSAAAREAYEAQHLNVAPWTRLRASDRGINALRVKLGAALLGIISRELPALQRDMERHVAKNKRTLEALGPVRTSIKEHRDHLLSVAEQLAALLRPALNGTYTNESSSAFRNISTFFHTHESHRLRDHVNGLSDRFTEEMMTSWRYKIMGTVSDDAYDPTRPMTVPSEASSSDETRRIMFGSPDCAEIMEEVSLDDFCEDLAEYSLMSRGIYLPVLTPAPIVLEDVFRLQSVHWPAKCKDYVERCINAVWGFMLDALHHVAGHHSGDILWEDLAEPFLSSQSDKVYAKVEELLWPYMHKHPIAVSGLMSTMQSSDPWIHGDSTSVAPELQDALKVLVKAGRYALASIHILIDNIAILAVERCLLENLYNAVTTSRISSMSEEDVKRLGRSSDSDGAAREKAEAQLKVLEEVIKLCRTHGRNAVEAE